jgi:hypothetical protein
MALEKCIGSMEAITKANGNLVYKMAKVTFIQFRLDLYSNIRV